MVARETLESEWGERIPYMLGPHAVTVSVEVIYCLLDLAIVYQGLSTT